MWVTFNPFDPYKRVLSGLSFQTRLLNGVRVRHIFRTYIFRPDLNRTQFDPLPPLVGALSTSITQVLSDHTSPIFHPDTTLIFYRHFTHTYQHFNDSFLALWRNLTDTLMTLYQIFIDTFLIHYLFLLILYRHFTKPFLLYFFLHISTVRIITANKWDLTFGNLVRHV